MNFHSLAKVNRVAFVSFLIFELIEKIYCLIKLQHEKDTTRILLRYRQLAWLKPIYRSS